MSSSSTSSPTDQFGPNEWLVEEMYQRFLDDPNSVDPAWHDFFADYRPGDASPTSGSAAQTAAHTTAAPSPLTPIEKPGRQAPHREPAAAEEPAAPRAAAAPKTTAKPAAGTNSQAAAPPAASPEHATDGVTTALRGAASLVVKNMNASLEVPTATLGARRAGEADGRQPDRHQQLPAAQPRREDHLHAPDRVRHRPGDRRLPGA